MLGTPLSDAAFATATTNFYAKSRLAADIDLFSVPPASTRSGDSSKSSDVTKAQGQPHQARPAPRSPAPHGHVDRVTISSEAKAVQLPVSAAAAGVSSTQVPAAANDADSDMAREATESAKSAARAVEAGETTAQASQGSRVQSQSSGVQSTYSTKAGSSKTSGVDTYA